MTNLGSGASRYDFFVIGAFRYPAGDASANRMLGLAKCAAAAGYNPLVINDAPPTDGGRPSTIGAYDGVDYVCIGEQGASRSRRFVRRLNRPVRLANTIRRLRSPGRRSYATFASGLYTLGAHLVLHTLLRVTMISDVVERHDVEQFPLGWRSPYLVRHRWTSRLSQILPDGVIAVSRTLEGGYAERRPVLRIPPLIDMAEYATPSPRDPRDPLTLLYIGSPSNKDQLGVLVDAVMDQDGAPRPILLRVAGADSNQLAANEDVGPDRVSKFGNVVQVLGRLEREEVLTQLREADFSVVLRPRAGYAQAGFPSKVPESLAAGCPLFANITSDLADYLRDLDNSVICETGADGQVTADAVATALRRANGLTDPELHSLRLRARETAAQLHYGAWAPALRAWLVTLS